MKTNHFVSTFGPLWGAACVSLLLGFNASGQFVVANGESYTIDPPVTVNVHEFDTGGSRDVIIQLGGSITANTRVNMDGQITSPPNACQLILDGGSFTQAVDTAGIKFPDNTGPVEIRINSGTLSAVNIQHLGWNAARGPAVILIGNGQLILGDGYLEGNKDYDAALWTNFPNTVVGGVAYANGLKALAGYELSFTDLGGGAVIISGVASTNCPAITLSTSTPSVPGETNSIFVSLTPGLNATQATTADLVSANTNVAVPQGAVNGVLTLTFPAGGHYVTNILFNAVGAGSTVFYLTNASAATCVTTTESQIKVGVRSSLFVAQDARIVGLLDNRDTNYATENLQVSQSAGTQGGRKSYLLFDATGLPEILSVDDFQIQRAGGTTSRSIQLYAILGTNDFLGSVNHWTETGITWNNAPANNTNTVNIDTNRAFVTYPGESLMFIEDFSTGSASDTVYNVTVFRDLAEADRQTILTALNTGDRKLTLGLQYVSSQATIISFRSREFGVESSIPRLNVTLAAAPVVAPVEIQTVKVNQTGDQLELTGQGGTTWGTYHLLSSANVAEPLINWIPVATNQFSNATFSLSIPFDPADPPSFFVLQVQTP